MEKVLRVARASIEAVEAAANLAVTSRSTLTRMVAGGPLPGLLGILTGASAKKSTAVDTGKFHSLLETRDFASLIVCKPDDGEKGGDGRSKNV